MIDLTEISNQRQNTSVRAAVQVEHVTKTFGATTALSDINMAIAPGEFFSFLGPSGCGKTTLLRMIAGFENPSEGKVSINGLDMHGVPPHKRPVNMVFQNYALFPHLTIGENVAFGLKSVKKFSRPEIAERVKSALELVRLSEFLERLPAQISGGQQQRAALARAVVNDPAVLLLDEPLSALDPQIREEMQFELARLQNRLQITFVMVTHDQNEALALSSRVAVFRRGHLDQVGTPFEIYNSPKTLFVAKFVGQTNSLDGQVIGGTSSQYRVAVDGLDILVKRGAETVPEAAPVTLLVKPQSVKFLVDEVSGGENVYEAEVLNRSFQGTSTEFLLKLTEKIELRASCANDWFARENQFERRPKLRISIPSEAIYILPRD